MEVAACRAQVAGPVSDLPDWSANHANKRERFQATRTAHETHESHETRNGEDKPITALVLLLAFALGCRPKNSRMPYVNVKITKDGVTTAQKRKIVADITQSLVSTLGKKPEHIHIVIDEVDPENWGFAGLLTPEYRAQVKSKAKNPVTVKASGGSRPTDQ